MLLTPDDRGGPVAAAYDEQKLRARQNVILELGYFVGTLGRGKVCMLYVEGIERPSDIDGVGYVALDKGKAWRLAVALELKTVFPDLDLNKLGRG